MNKTGENMIEKSITDKIITKDKKLITLAIKIITLMISDKS